MSALFNNISNLGRRFDYGIGGPIGNAVGKFDPSMGWVMKGDLAAQNAVLGKPGGGRRYYGEGPIAPPGPPTQDVAANAALQQQNLQRRRLGVLGNIYAGGNAAAPQVQSKSALGN